MKFLCACQSLAQSQKFGNPNSDSYVNDNTLEVVGFTVDLHEGLIQMPLPIRMSAKVLNPISSDLGGEHRAEPVPPKPHRLVANINTALMQQILDVP